MEKASGVFGAGFADGPCAYFCGSRLPLLRGLKVVLLSIFVLLAALAPCVKTTIERRRAVYLGI